MNEVANLYMMRAKTDEHGAFMLTGLPDADILLSTGDRFPFTDAPYGRLYYPSARAREAATVFRLKPGERREAIRLRLEAPIEQMTVSVRVVHKQGGPPKNAIVDAFDGEGMIMESARANKQGIARVPCLRGFRYELVAQTSRPLPWRGNLLKSSPAPFTCGDSSNVIPLVLEHSVPH